MKSRSIVAIVYVLLASSPALAFNALGHKVVAKIAWGQLTIQQREAIVATLRRHPRFDDDFAKAMPADVKDEADWIFQHAATWPDLARGLQGDARKRFDQPTWHYVNFPHIIDGTPVPIGLNLTALYPTNVHFQKWNIVQAVKHCQFMLAGDGPPSEKALAYCWLFHVVGDAHQPLHSTALVCERFPNGDRGGNSVPTVQGGDLHALWDGLLGKSHKPNDVLREVTGLGRNKALWNVDTSGGVEAWLQESHEIAKAVVYDPVIVDAVKQPGELAPINLPQAYLTTAGNQARHQAVAAGLRLTKVLQSIPATMPPAAAPVVKPPAPLAVAPAQLAAKASAVAPKPIDATRVESTPSPQPAMGYWLNTNGGVRHNSTCRWYHNTKRGRACGPDEGRACGICGG